MARSGVKLVGLPEMEREIKTLTKRVQGRMLDKALMDASTPIEHAAVIKVPHDDGQLADSITKEVEVRKSGYREVWIGPGDDGFYGYFLERGWWAMGTSRRSLSKFASPGQAVRARKNKTLGQFGKWQSPTPFMRPAFDGNVDAAEERFKRGLQEILRMR